MPIDPAINDYHFVIEIGGVEVGAFRAIEVKATEPGEGTLPTFRQVPRPVALRSQPTQQARKRPGSFKWGDLTLKTGLKRAGPSLRAGAPADATHKANVATGGARLDDVAHKAQASTLVLAGFVPSGRRVAETAEPQGGRIVLKNSRGAPIRHWNFADAWPSKWKGDALRATGDVTVVVTGLQRG
jgi:hypothetical protein